VFGLGVDTAQFAVAGVALDGEERRVADQDAQAAKAVGLREGDMSAPDGAEWGGYSNSGDSGVGR